jgi:hypothetical protein
MCFELFKNGLEHASVLGFRKMNALGTALIVFGIALVCGGLILGRSIPDEAQDQVERGGAAATPPPAH